MSSRARRSGGSPCRARARRHDSARTSGEREKAGDAEPDLGLLLRRQRLAQGTIGEAERMLPEHVLEVGDHGATWHDIAAALATSPEQAELPQP